MKDDLRRWAKAVRASLDMKSISAELVEILLQSEEYSRAKNIMIFYPKDNEVNLLPILEDKTKKFYLPKIDGDNLQCCPFTEDTILSDSVFNTKEPVSEACNPALMDLIIVPALVCDRDNYRLGYGKGFYDRFLQNLKAVKIVCIPESLVVDTIYPNNYDVKMDKIITA